MSNKDRKQTAYEVRIAAAELARTRPHPAHEANGDEQRYASAHHALSFTKGLHHDKALGVVADPADFVDFRKAIDDGFVDAFNTRVDGAMNVASGSGKNITFAVGRPWEAPTTGVVFNLEGPDPQATTMPPAPAFPSDELAYEMAEVYELALLRDVDLGAFADPPSRSDVTNKAAKAVRDAAKALGKLAYDEVDHFDGRPRITDAHGDVGPQQVFRGSSPGVDVGPYVSQFLWIGNDSPNGDARVGDGKINDGPLQIDQRVPIATEKDWMTTWSTWFDVQQGKDTRDDATLFVQSNAKHTHTVRRFISRPRDLATYVHDDALYEAYLNACLILLSMQTPFDPGFAELSGQQVPPVVVSKADRRFRMPRQVGGFALWGGPHVLTLVTEVATRALKAVRFQKFNTHIRSRPEALAARIHKAADLDAAFPQHGGDFSAFRAAVGGVVGRIEKANGPKGTALLPMAFQEGSPMHPAYGAGHATVAGACVTILKAFFDTSSVFVTDGDGKDVFKRHGKGDTPVQYVATADGSCLERQPGCAATLTLEGELNKLAANISIGRNMAGVHYFSDYYDSLRMGEEIAVGILEEQALCYPTDPFVLSLPTFDGPTVRIGAR